MTYPDGETVDQDYHPQGSLAGMGDYLTEAAYDAAGRLVRRILGNGVQVDYGYYPWDEQGGRMQAMTAAGPGGALQELSYRYDAVGNVVEIVDGVHEESHAYTYDGLDRLTYWKMEGGEERLWPEEESYSYGEQGSMMRKGENVLYYEDPDHVHAVSRTRMGYRYVYDANGNLRARESTAGGAGLSLDYDAAGRLVGAALTRPEGEGMEAVYVYDGDGNQVIAEVDGELRVYIGGHYEIALVAEKEEPPPEEGLCPEGTWCLYLPGVQGGEGAPPELRQRDPLPGEGITVWRSYYLAGGVRIAMRTVTEGEAPAGVVTYLLGDHLGSTSVSVDGAAPECHRGTSRGKPGFRRTRPWKPHRNSALQALRGGAGGGWRDPHGLHLHRSAGGSGAGADVLRGALVARSLPEASVSERRGMTRTSPTLCRRIRSCPARGTPPRGIGTRM